MDIQSLFGVKVTPHPPLFLTSSCISLTHPQDKVVLITGGAKGVGRMISEAFVRNGAKVYIASRDAAACEAACAELNALSSSSSGSGSAVSLPADLSQLSECQRLATTLAQREKALHVLINNSGATWGEPYDTYPDAAWTKLLTLNLQRVFTLTQALTPLLEAAGAASKQGDVVLDPGRVIHIGSIDALRTPLLPTFAYSASKAGLHHLSRHLAIELGPRGVTSNVLACGPFPSKMMAATLKEFGEEIKGANPLGRIGMPSDVGGACIFLASKAGGFVNGATLALDGGVRLMSKI
jgi:NAD(P)-dependent dehydrogenase (short-subunit alcohol dehydrogenase family)